MSKKVKCPRCGAIYWTSRYDRCPECGKDAPKSRNGCSSVVLCLVAVAILVGIIYGLVSGYEKNGQSSILGKIFSNLEKTTISYEEYAQINEGMTYEECCKIIGGKGILWNENMIDLGYPTSYTFYYWPGETVVGHAVLMFENGKLVMKEETALRVE